MTIEEKAKAYDKALENAKEWAKNPTVWNSDDICQKLFPELKENENERMIKSFTRLVKAFYDCNFSTPEGFERKDMIAWLEKQGNNNNQNWKPSKGQINALEHFVRSIGESGYASPYDDNTKLLFSLLHDLKKLEEQGEHKFIVDFKASNWYVSKVDGKIHDLTYNPTDKKELKKLTQSVTKISDKVWSEEDDKRLVNTTISFLNDYADKGYENSVECIDWLKSLKERLKGE